MSQVPMSQDPTGSPPAPGGRPPLGAGGWIAIAVSAVVGLLYTGVLGTLLALGFGAAVDASIDALPTPAPGFSDDPFGSSTDDPFDGGDPSDPLYDYPGYLDGDAAVVLAQPSAEEAVALSEAAVGAAEAEALGGWSSADDEYYEQSENAYGGPSLLHDYISSTHYADADLSSGADKQAVVDRFTAALVPLGFDEIDVADTPAEWSDVGYDLVGTLSDEEASASLWIVTASSSTEAVPAVELGLVDLDADPSGEVRAMLEDVGISPSDSGAFLAAYANGLLEEGDRAEFTRRMEEFGGIATT